MSRVVDAYILIQAELSKTSIVAALVGAVPGVSETEIVTGPYDVIARAQAPDMKLAGQVTSQIQAIRGVTRTTTCIIVQPSRHRPISPRRTRWIRQARVDGPMTASEDHTDSTGRNYWDEPSELAYAKAVVGKKHQGDPARQWHRLPSLESFKAGRSCGWVSDERDTFDEMSHDVDGHLDAVRHPRAAPPPSAGSH